MLQRTPQLPDAIAIHEAAYRVAGRKFGIRPRKTRTDLGLRRFANDVFDVAAAVEQRGAEAAASILLIGRAAVGALAPAHLADCSYDQIEAGNVLYLALYWRGGTLQNPNQYREHHFALARLQTEAETFVGEHRAEIVRTASNLAATTDDLAATS
jgi:hypothetical protein